MTTPHLDLGDHLAVQHLGYTHHGLYVGNHQVIHYQGSSSGDGSEGQIVLSSLDEFVHQQSVRVISHRRSRFSREACVARAFSRLGEQQYHLLFNNCEHFVMWCIEDRHTSTQVNDAATVVAAAGVAALTPTQTSRAVASVLAGTVARSVATPVASSTVLSVSACTAPAWVPLAIGASVAYGTYRLVKWLTD